MPADVDAVARILRAVVTGFSDGEGGAGDLMQIRCQLMCHRPVREEFAVIDNLVVRGAVLRQDDFRMQQERGEQEK